MAHTRPKEARIERRRVDQLIPYPRQQQFFQPVTDEVAIAIAQAMLAGQAPTIDILGPNECGIPIDTILRGHQRHRGLTLLGMKKAEVNVRYDLRTATRAELDREFLVDNFHRRHADLLSQAQIVLELFRLERKDPKGRLSTSERQKARDRIAQALDMSPKNAQRYMEVAEAPTTVQAAYRAKRLSLVAAARIGAMAPEEQQQIADRLERGEPPAEILASFRGETRRENVMEYAIDRLSREVVRCKAVLDGRLIDLRGERAIDPRIKHLREGADFIEQLAQQLEQARQKRIQHQARQARKFGQRKTARKNEDGGIYGRGES